jgi:hypothetical protein
MLVFFIIFAIVVFGLLSVDVAKIHYLSDTAKQIGLKIAVCDKLSAIAAILTVIYGLALLLHLYS